MRQNNSLSFSSKGREGESVEKIVCTPRYITVEELRKPAVVTDRLRRDYDDLRQFDRVSMKAGIRKILTTSEVVKAVNAYWSGAVDDSTIGGCKNDEEVMVSNIQFEEEIMILMKYDENGIEIVML